MTFSNLRDAWDSLSCSSMANLPILTTVGSVTSGIGFQPPCKADECLVQERNMMRNVRMKRLCILEKVVHVRDGVVVFYKDMRMSHGMHTSLMFVIFFLILYF
ncbi:hypothetical protein Hanom_Chr07g00584081 [Helianthus anomalus]